MALHRPGDKPLSEQMMVRLLTHICITQPQWVDLSYICILYIFTMYFLANVLFILWYALILHCLLIVFVPYAGDELMVPDLTTRFICFVNNSYSTYTFTWMHSHGLSLIQKPIYRVVLCIHWLNSLMNFLHKGTVMWKATQWHDILCLWRKEILGCHLILYHSSAMMIEIGRVFGIDSEQRQRYTLSADGLTTKGTRPSAVMVSAVMIFNHVPRIMWNSHAKGSF